jgi:mannitol/fructose-specific phosphotransferase system IIA component (Ntr-type)
MLLSEVFDTRSIRLNLASTKKEDSFAELVDALLAAHPDLDRRAVLAAIQDREAKQNTAIAEGVAVPHGYYSGAGGIFGALGISARGVDYGASQGEASPLDCKPVHCIFLLVSGETEREKHLLVLNRVLALINSEAIARMRNAANTEEISAIFSHAG